MFAASKSGRAASAAATDPYFPYVPLLLESTSTNGQQNNTFLDSSTNNFTITRNGTPTQGSVTPYWPNGQWSNNFGSSAGQYIRVGSSANITLGAGNFTCECWVFPTAFTTLYAALWDFRSTGGFIAGSPLIWVGTDGKVNYQNAAIASSGSLNLNAWSHVAVVRNGTTVTMYINGASVGSVTDSTTMTNTYCGIGAANDTPSSYYFSGYISNSRVVIGTAVYTSAFTPPTTPLTAITNTSLLTCQSNRLRDNSANNFTITVNGTPRVQAFQPFSPTASYTAAAYGGSGYFNGSTDYLYAGQNAAFAFGTGDFTVEFWVNTSSSTAQMVFDTIQPGIGGGGTDRFFVYINTDQTIISGPVGSTQTTSNKIVLGAWNHVAVVRASGTRTTYINGVSGASGAYSSNLTSNYASIGLDRGLGGTILLNGFLSNFRAVKGTAVYTGAFTPPTAPVTAITNTSLLTNFTNAGIYDAAAQNNTITVGDAQASTTQSKWSPTSMKFDGTGDWLTAIDNPQLQLGTGDFTIDGWVYLSATGVAYGIISKGTASTGWSVNVTSGNKLQFSYTASNLTGATSLAATTWYYFAVVRSGSATGNLKVYLNGTADATSGGAVTDNFNQTNILYVGADRVGATPLNGYLQDVRITKAARTITTPTAAFPTR